MLKRGNKRGQFYLLVTVVIISLIGGFLLITNYSKKNNDIRVYNLGEELKTESAGMLDYGAVTGNYRWDEFTKNFSDYAGKDINITFIVGSLGSPDIYRYNEDGNKEIVSSSLNWNLLSITANNINYEFVLRPGENFYFIMSQDIGGERYVATNA